MEPVCLLPSSLSLLVPAPPLHFVTWSHYIAKSGLQFLILLPQLPVCWHYRLVPPPLPMRICFWVSKCCMCCFWVGPSLFSNLYHPSLPVKPRQNCLSQIFLVCSMCVGGYRRCFQDPELWGLLLQSCLPAAALQAVREAATPVNH